MNGCVGKSAQLRRCIPDDTGWRVAGQPAQMMGFESAEASVYQIRPRHRMLQDVVISRKVSQGSKNERGARATETFRSVSRSAD